MKSLVRLKVGPFGIEDAVTLGQLEEAFRQGRGQSCLYPIDYVLTSFSAIIVNHEQQCALIHGSPIALPNLPGTAEQSHSRVYTEDGRFLGMARFDPENNRWQAEKIFLRQCHEL